MCFFKKKSQKHCNVSLRKKDKRGWLVKVSKEQIMGIGDRTMSLTQREFWQQYATSLMTYVVNFGGISSLSFQTGNHSLCQSVPRGKPFSRTVKYTLRMSHQLIYILKLAGSLGGFSAEDLHPSWAWCYLHTCPLWSLIQFKCVVAWHFKNQQETPLWELKGCVYLLFLILLLATNSSSLPLGRCVLSFQFP